MYLVTFYSYKGGVGRSMALANVATQLAKRGKRVLLVDFDLEAPGLTTFDFSFPKDFKGGVVDFVSEYLETNKSPDVKEHVHLCSTPGIEDEKLWIMPAGTQDDQYGEKLSKLNWGELYKKHSGYLFLEDLKAQWQEAFDPDYVLIDSRTGLTDVGGICTRQLPNAIVFLFFPNEQNLIGLRKVVNAVDMENTERRQLGIETLIDTHFVTSNVPDLDDEDSILADRLISFSQDLNYTDLTATIHRYNSLALLNQEIFSITRPNTRLAQEYAQLTNQIVMSNLEDTDGAEAFLREVITNFSNENFYEGAINIKEKIEIILTRHKRNPEIINLVSFLKERTGDFEEAIGLIERVKNIDANTSPAIKIRLARLKSYIGRNEESVVDTKDVLKNTELSYADTSFALNLLSRHDRNSLTLFKNSPSILKLKPLELIELISVHFVSSTDTLELAVELLENYLDSSNYITNEEHEIIEGQIGLVKLADGRAEEAIHTICDHRPNDVDSVSDVFNYAMAEWCINRKIPKDLFQIVLIKLQEIDFSVADLNTKQCMALSYWAAGKQESALTALDVAFQDVLDSQIEVFSCWTYLHSSPEEFHSDLKEMKKMFSGDKTVPAFFNRKDFLSNGRQNPSDLNI